jgi:mannitol-1-phosphate 5-dehydrogenase
LHPDAVYMYEILDDSRVLRFTRDVMLQSADILLTVYPHDFTASDLEDHTDDLIFRFRNKALKDTIFRVGHDLTRKLSQDDRFMGAIHLAVKYNKPYDLILQAMAYGLTFSAKDEKGILFPSDKSFLESISKEFELTMINNLGFNQVVDGAVIEELKIQFKNLAYGSETTL